MAKRFGCVSAVCFLNVALFAQTDTPAALNSRAIAAYQSKDYATFLLLEKQLLSLSPNDPRNIYNVASGEALAGHAAQAVAPLEKLIATYHDFGADKDHDFDGIRKTPEWNLYAQHLAAMRKPMVASAVAFTLPEKGLLASGVAVDAQRGDTYIASLRERKIIKRSKEGVLSDFATEKDGLLAVFSLLIDPVHNQLFVGTAAGPFMQNYKKEDEGKAGVLAFDITTGKLVRSALLTASSDHHLFSQMTQDQRGNLFLLDTGTSEVYRLRRSSTELELFLSSVVFQSPRGIALSADDNTLYVTDLATGLWAVHILSIDQTHINVPDALWLGALVGLIRTPEGLISLEGGAAITRVVRIRLDEKHQSVVSVETLEKNNELYDSPTLGSLSGNDLYFVANSQFNLIDRKTGAFASDKAKETIILRLPLVTH